jgi:hypothetical protein
LRPELGIAAGVVAMPVGVQHEVHGLFGDRPDGRQDLFAQWRELIVDQQHPVGAHR